MVIVKFCDTVVASVWTAKNASRVSRRIMQPGTSVNDVIPSLSVAMATLRR